MSQRQLARRAAVHPSTVSRVLRGAVPTLPTALALQDALDPSEPSAPGPDAPELHPALLSAMLRRDGFLTNDEIWEVILFLYSDTGYRPRTFEEGGAEPAH